MTGGTRKQFERRMLYRHRFCSILMVKDKIGQRSGKDVDMNYGSSQHARTARNETPQSFIISSHDAGVIQNIVERYAAREGFSYPSR